MTDLERLELAFCMYVVEMILGADNVWTESERGWWRRTFPESELREAGFVDGDGAPTAALEQAQEHALRTLKHAMTLDDKLALLARFFDAGMADGTLHPEEMRLLSEGARFLDVPSEAFTDLMVRQALEHHRRTTQ